MSLLLPRESARVRPAALKRALHMCIEDRNRLRRMLGTVAVAIAGVLVMAASAPAQSTFGSLAVASSATQTVTVTGQAAGTVKTVEVLTLGNSGLDFQSASGGSCSSANMIVGGTCTQPVTFTPAYPGGRFGAVVLLDGSNHVLGTEYLSGTGLGGLGLLIPGNMITVAGDGNFKDPDVGDGNPATQAELYLPSAQVFDGVGNMYIADTIHNRIRMVCAGTATTIPGTTCPGAGIIETIAGVTGAAGYSGDGSLSTSSSVTMSEPGGIAIDGAGNIYIADTGNNVIREISSATGKINTIAGTGNQGSSGDGGPALAAELNQPEGLALDIAGNLYIADSQNNKVRALCAGTASLFGVACTAQGNIVTVAGTGTQGSGGDGGQATAAEMAGPGAIAFDGSGNLFIADSGNSKIRAICLSSSTTVLGAACSATGIISTAAGTGVGNFAGDGGPATAAEINTPSGLVFDPAGNLYIADTQNFRIRKVNSATDIISTIAGNGSAGYGGDGGPAPLAVLDGPFGLTLDGNGNLYIADHLNTRIREIQSNLTIVKEANPVRQGSTSPTTNITVENDGNGALTLTTIVAGVNSSTDPASTTCQNGNSLAVLGTCVVGAVFAPASSPTLTGNTVETGDIDVNDDVVPSVTGSNSPLDIRVTGTAEPVNATNVALTSTPNPSQFGQSVTFTATVTTGAGTGTLTGTVTFYDGANTLQANVPLTSGAATYATSALTVGQHSITASYSGDSEHFADTSAAVVQVVNEATATALTSNANPSALNSSVTFTATVTAPNGGGVNPDGTVTFMDGNNALATLPLGAGGTVQYSTAALAEGVHSMTAVFSGDATTFILGSTSAVLSQDVVAASTVVVTGAPNPSTYGTPVTFTATVTANGTSAPTGTVNFLDGGNQIGSGTIVGTTGVATFQTGALTVGTHSITAAYVGDTNNGPGTSKAVNQVVNLAQTSTALVPTPSPGIAGTQETLTATVTLASGSATITGTVTFTDGGATLGTGTVGAGGVATFTGSLAPGTHTLVAKYGGDVNDDASTSATVTLIINQATTQVALTSSGSPAVVLSSVVFTAVVTGNGGTPTGTVTFAVDGTNAGTGTLDATGTATFSDSGLAVGNHTVVATYGGDTNDAGSVSASLAIVITAIPTVTDLGASSTGGATPQAILVATTLSSSGPVPTGTITFNNGSTVIGTATLDSSGVATLVPDLPTGTYNIVANYGGDSLHSPSSSQAVQISGAPAGFSISVTPGSLSLVSGQNGTVTVTITSQAGFSDKIGMGCLTVPAAVNCHFSSAQVALASNSTQTVQLTIDTNAPLSGGQQANVGRPGGTTLAGIFGLPGLLLGWLIWRFRRRNAAVLIAALALFLAGAYAMTGCSSNFSQVTAAPGTYTLQVGGIGSSSNLSHYQNFTLTVTK